MLKIILQKLAYRINTLSRKQFIVLCWSFGFVDALIVVGIIGTIYHFVK